MKTLEEFKHCLDIDHDLAAALAKRGTKRKLSWNYLLVSIVGVLFFIGGVAYFSSPCGQGYGGCEKFPDADNAVISYIIGGLLLFLVVYILHAIVKIRARNSLAGTENKSLLDFRDKAVRRIVAFCDPAFRYEITAFVELPVIMGSGMLLDMDYTIAGSDLIKGTHKEVPFSLSDVILRLSRPFSPSGEDPWELVFSGSVFVAGFERKFKAPVFVYPRKSHVAHLRHRGHEVKSESPAFDKMFRIYSPDRIVVGHILSASLISCIEKLAELSGNQLHVVFINNSVYIANNNHHAGRFEHILTVAANKKEKLIEWFEEFNTQLAITEELNRNPKIWE